MWGRGEGGREGGYWKEGVRKGEEGGKDMDH